MIRVLLVTPMADEEIPPETNSVNSVQVDLQNYMALYYTSFPIPASIDPANIFEIYDSETTDEETPDDLVAEAQAWFIGVKNGN